MKSGALSRADTGSKVTLGQNAPSENTPLISSTQPGVSYADVARHGTNLSQDTTQVASPATSSSPSIVRDHGGGYDGADDSVFPPTNQEDNRSQKANQSIGRLRAFGVAGSLFVLIFLQAANMSGMTTLQSSIANSLEASGSQALWFTSAYLIAMSSMAPLIGRLSQLFSPRYLVLVSASVFACGGLITGLAKTYESFIAGRVISGVGGAGIMTLCLILVLELTGPKRRGLFIGLVNMGYTIGVSLGAVVAGASLGVFGWRPLFYAQMPISLLAGLGIYLSIPTHFSSGTSDSPSTALTFKQKLMSIDYAGAVLLVSTIVLFLYGLSSPEIQFVPISIAIMLLPLFILNELMFTSTPLIPLSLLRSRGVLLTCLAQVGFMSVRWSILFYTPVYAISLLNWGPASAGSILIPTNLGFALGGLIAGHFHIRRSGSFYLACIISFFLFTLSIGILAILTTQPHYHAAIGWKGHVWAYILTTFLGGFFTGGALNYTLAHLLHLTHPSTHFIATSLMATFRGFAGSFGSAIGGGLFLRTLKDSLSRGPSGEGSMPGARPPAPGSSGLSDELIRKLLASPSLVPELRGHKAEVARFAYQHALRTVFFWGAGLAVVVIFVQAGTGWAKGEMVEEGDEEGDEERNEQIIVD